MPLIPKFVPIEFACRLRTLRQGSLDVGNTQQNRLNLIALAQAEAASPTTGWAKYSTAANAGYKLLVCPEMTPGYIGPVGTGRQNVVAASSGYTFSMTAGTDGVLVGFDIGNVPPFGNSAATGSVTPGTVNGETIAVFGYDTSNKNVYFVLEGILAQDFFTQISFTDRSSAVETYLSANATFAQSSGAHTYWEWLSSYAANGDPFTSGDTYNPVTVS